MILNVDISGAWESEDIDLESLYALSWVLGEDDMAEAIMLAVADLAIENGIAFELVEPDYIEDDNGNELNITSNPGMYWVREVAKFAWHVLWKSDSKGDWGKYFAYVDNEHWNQFDFDKMSKIDDEFRMEFDGDYEDYAREWMDEQGEDLPSHLEDHFDYKSYGEYLIDGENAIEWGYETYLFSE